MPYRKTPIVSGEIYHVFNRSIAKQPIFLNKKDYLRALDVIDFYHYKKLHLRFSFYKRLPIQERKLFFENLDKNKDTILDFLAYCLMPNHVHFLIKPKEDGSVSTFMSNFQNSYSKYFNTKYKRTGSLFQSMFKAVRIERDEQLIHVSRYIHLNPSTSFLIQPEFLESYPWSSFREYISGANKNSLVDTKLIFGLFRTREKYKRFVLDYADYQRKLDEIKHLVME